MRASANISVLPLQPLCIRSSVLFCFRLRSLGEPDSFTQQSTPRIKSAPIGFVFFWLLAALVGIQRRCVHRHGAPTLHHKLARQLRVDSWQMRDGLPGQTVRAFSETPDGICGLEPAADLRVSMARNIQTYTHQNCRRFETTLSIVC